jgi:beta-1,4-mannooligosaccharide/beta-1,4-mannosyl-N-acetylglucosamine phosphorylase
MPPFITAAPIQRYTGNPVLSAKDVPYEALLIFNAGVAKYQGRYVMLFRNDYGRDPSTPHPLHTNMGLAFSDDGIHWQVQPQPCFELHDAEIRRVYDPRLTVIDGRCYACFAVDTRHGIRGGIAVTEDFAHFDILSMSAPDNRNMVLFPERIGGKYARLERPFPVYGRGGADRFDIWYADSPDLRYWGNQQLVLGVEDVPFANDKLGPAAPPVKTPQGWLTTFHAVMRDPERGKHGWEDRWQKVYYAGIMLLDLEEPWKVIGMSKLPLIAPETPYESEEGFRTDVIFPGGMILEESGEVKIYYGAADTVECLATAEVGELVKLCKEK